MPDRYEVKVAESAKKMKFVLEGLFWDDTPDVVLQLVRHGLPNWGPLAFNL